jgi:hypothetical protein
MTYAMIDHGNLERADMPPAEHHPPLVVDPDRVKPLLSTLERFEPFSG